MRGRLSAGASAMRPGEGWAAGTADSSERGCAAASVELKVRPVAIAHAWGFDRKEGIVVSSAARLLSDHELAGRHRRQLVQARSNPDVDGPVFNLPLARGFVEVVEVGDAELDFDALALAGHDRRRAREAF